MHTFIAIAVLNLKYVYKTLRLWAYRLKGLLFQKNIGLPGKCSICGHYSTFCKRPGNVAHNTIECFRCGAMARYRAIAMVLGNQIKNNTHIDPTITLKSIKSMKHIRIYNTFYGGAFNRHLSRISTLVTSEYLPGLKRGRTYFGIRHETLNDLTFENNSIDIIITTEVMEHVYEPWKAFKEIYRVLKPGGCHIFTVPVGVNHPTEPRVQFDRGKLTHIKQPKYHRNPLSMKGSLVVTDFGNDLIKKLEEIGFKTEKYTLNYQEHCIFRTEVFLSKKCGHNR